MNRQECSRDTFEEVCKRIVCYFSFASSHRLGMGANNHRQLSNRDLTLRFYYFIRS